MNGSKKQTEVEYRRERQLKLLNQLRTGCDDGDIADIEAMFVECNTKINNQRIEINYQQSINGRAITESTRLRSKLWAIEKQVKRGLAT